jgi:hypothetical protein
MPGTKYQRAKNRRVLAFHTQCAAVKITLRATTVAVQEANGLFPLYT